MVGYPEDCGSDWTEDQIIVATNNSSHSSTIKEVVLQSLYKEENKKPSKGMQGCFLLKK